MSLILANNVCEASYKLRFPAQPVLRPLTPWETVQTPYPLGSTQQWALVEPFIYQSDRFGQIAIPATPLPVGKTGFVTDLASIPSLLQNALQNDSPQILCASIIHDWGFWMAGEVMPGRVLTFDQVNELLAEAMWYLNATDLQRNAVFSAVHVGGRGDWNADCDRVGHPERKVSLV